MQKYVPILTLTAIILFAFAVINILFALSILNEKIQKLSDRLNNTDNTLIDLNNKFNSWSIYETEK